MLILPDGYWHFHPGTFSLRCNAEQAHISFQRRGDVRCADTKSKLRHEVARSERARRSEARPMPEA